MCDHVLALQNSPPFKNNTKYRILISKKSGNHMLLTSKNYCILKENIIYT